jgi:hypothetical protein
MLFLKVLVDVLQRKLRGLQARFVGGERRVSPGLCPQRIEARVVRGEFRPERSQIVVRGRMEIALRACDL